MRLKLYGRAACHLCEEMASELRARGIDFDEVDVAQDAALEERYGRRVPVLTRGDGTEVCRYRLDEGALEGALGRQPRA